MVAGQEYQFDVHTTSHFGKASTQISFTQSVYTDVRLPSSRTEITDDQMVWIFKVESGVGSSVEAFLNCTEYSWIKQYRYAQFRFAHNLFFLRK